MRLGWRHDLRVVITAVFVLAVAGYARADDIADFDLALDKFLAEQDIFLNCTALDPKAHELAIGAFNDMVTTTSDLLRTYGTPQYRTRFQERTAVGSMVMRERKLGDVMDFCAKNKGWEKHFTAGNLSFFRTKQAVSFMIGITGSNKAS